MLRVSSFTSQSWCLAGSLVEGLIDVDGVVGRVGDRTGHRPNFSAARCNRNTSIGRLLAIVGASCFGFQSKILLMSLVSGGY